MRFGVGDSNKCSGAELYVIVFRLCNLCALAYILFAAGNPMLLSARNAFTAVFDVGVSAMPRFEALLLSMLYRTSYSETAVYFSALFFAFPGGAVMNLLFRAKFPAARAARWLAAAAIAADLVLRALPFGFNAAFAALPTALGAALRAACLLLILADLIAYRRKRKA